MKIHPEEYERIVFFTGAGMSAECGVPTYRGKGGIWHQYNWEDYACQEAFETNPEKVLDFHELRRRTLVTCEPHAGHHVITTLEKTHPGIHIVTQNIDGMHQRTGSRRVIELHGSAWRLRCVRHGVREDHGETYERRRCEHCGLWLRPDIVWFGDALDPQVVQSALEIIGGCDLFIAVGTSGVVWPAAGFPAVARRNGARCVEINPEPGELSGLYDDVIREPAGNALTNLFSV